MAAIINALGVIIAAIIQAKKGNEIKLLKEKLKETESTTQTNSEILHSGEVIENAYSVNIEEIDVEGVLNIHPKSYIYDTVSADVRTSDSYLELSMIFEGHDIEENNNRFKDYVKGKGPILHNAAVITFEGLGHSDSHPKYRWHGAFVLIAEKSRTPTGYWVSKHNLKPNGPFAFGKIEFVSKTQEKRHAKKLKLVKTKD